MALVGTPFVSLREKRRGGGFNDRVTDMRFTKMQAAGNDYVYMDTFKAPISSPEALARRISDRHFGVSSEQSFSAPSPIPARRIFGCGCSMRTARRPKCAATVSAA